MPRVCPSRGWAMPPGVAAVAGLRQPFPGPAALEPRFPPALPPPGCP